MIWKKAQTELKRGETKGGQERKVSLLRRLNRSLRNCSKKWQVMPVSLKNCLGGRGGNRWQRVLVTFYVIFRVERVLNEWCERMVKFLQKVGHENIRISGKSKII